MSNNVRCGSNDCRKNIPPHLRYISCFACKFFYHVRCCNVNKKQFDNLKNSGENWLCFKCRPKEPSVHCGSCKKPIPKNNVIIQCSFCDDFFHSKCAKISFDNFRRSQSWACTPCLSKTIPFSSLDHEDFSITMQAKDLPLGDFLSMSPSFQIDSLIQNLGGNENDDYVCDLTNSKYYTPSEFLSKKFPRDNFSMFHINIASLSLHLDDLKALLHIIDHPFDIIAVSETKIKEGLDPITNISIDGYNFVHTPTKTDFGGVGLFINSKYTAKPRDDLSFSIRTIFESIFIELESDNSKNLVIGCIYRHHTPITNFISNFSEKILQKLHNEKNKVCALLGDFNIDLLQTDNHDNTCEFYDVISAFGFRPLVLQPTRVQTTSRGTSATLSDNIFVSDFENLSDGGNITASISDHFAQFCSISNFFNPPKMPNNHLRYGRNFKLFNNREFQEELLKINWDENFLNKGTDDCTKFLVNKIEHLLDEMAPYKRLSKREINLKQRPWINHEILEIMNERDNFHKQYIKENDPIRKSIIFRIYKSKRNTVVKMIRQSRNNYYSEYFERNKNNSKKTWEGIRDVINISKKTHTVPKKLLYNNITHTDSESMSNCFNDFFVNIGNSVEAKIPNVDTNFTDFLKNRNDFSLFLKPVNEEELKTMISNLATSKSCGPNSIPTHILKTNFEFLALPLKHIINLSFTEGCFPQLLKLAEVCPIFKKKDKNK